MTIANTKKDVRNHVKKSIANQGFAILSVDGSPMQGANPINYSYTVGLTSKGLPELYMAGAVPNNVLGGLIKSQAMAWIAEGKPDLCVREDIVNVNKPEQPRRSLTVLVDSKTLMAEKCSYLSRHYPRRQLKIAQMCFPDPANLLPLEPGYDTRYSQPPYSQQVPEVSLA